MKKVIYILLSCLFMVSLSACGPRVTEEEVQEAITNKDAETLAELVNTYTEHGGSDELDALIEKSFKKMVQSTEYSDFLFIDKTVKNMPDSDLKDKVKKSINDHYKNRMIAFMKGKWVRRDLTALDGLVIDVTFDKNVGTAKITSKKAVARKTKFKKKDKKWTNLKVSSNKQFTLKDLSRDKKHKDYVGAKATLDYSGILRITLNEENSGYTSGNTQVWIKQSVLDDKSILDKTDFIVKRDNKDVTYASSSDNVNYEFSYALIPQDTYRTDVLDYKKDEQEAILPRGIKLTDKSSAIIKVFGYGRFLELPYKQDNFYRYFKDRASASSGKEKTYYKSLASSMKNASYSYVYFNKKETKYIKMYFTKDDQLTVILFGKNFNGIQNLD